MWSFPLDLADSARALPLLAENACSALGRGDRERLAVRRTTLAARSAAQRAVRRQVGSQAAGLHPIAPEWLGVCLDEVRRAVPGFIFVDETATNSATLMQQVAATEPGTWFKSGGPGLGWGLARPSASSRHYGPRGRGPNGRWRVHVR